MRRLSLRSESPCRGGRLATGRGIVPLTGGGHERRHLGAPGFARANSRYLSGLICHARIAFPRGSGPGVFADSTESRVSSQAGLPPLNLVENLPNCVVGPAHLNVDYRRQ